MADLISLAGAKDERAKQDRAYMVQRLEELLEEAKNGDILAISFVAIRAGRGTLSIGHLKAGECGVHELVGATRILSDMTAAAASEAEFDE